MIRKRIVENFKPDSLLDCWTITVFLIAVITLFSLRGMEWRILFFFLFPPILAFFYQSRSSRKSTRILCTIFLTLLSAGITLAPIHQLFPHLKGVDPRLSREHDRILSWYGVIYLLYMIVLPSMLFLRNWLDYYRDMNPQFSRFTCILGLLTILLLAPAVVWICYELLGLDSIWSSEEKDTPQSPPTVDSDKQLRVSKFTAGGNVIYSTESYSVRVFF